MKIDLRLTTKREAYIIKNMFPLYVYDLAQYTGALPNRHGIYDDSDDFKTLIDQCEIQNIWWEKPDCLYPFLILVDHRPAGFILIATPPYCAKETEYFVNEFFLLHPWRNQGIGQSAVLKVFDQFPGKWELFTSPSEKNIRGQNFWRKIIAKYSNGHYVEQYDNTFDGYKLIFRFDNTVV